MSTWRRFSEKLNERYLEVDARSLGLFRIGLGLLCLTNLYDRFRDGGFVAFYTNDGVFTNHYSLFAPPAARLWSLLFGFSTPNEVAFAAAFVALVYVLYTVGWRTGLMKWLLLACVLSVQNRALFMQNGGHVVMHILAVWGALLPVGARFSVDSLARSLKASSERSAAELRARAWTGSVVKTHRAFAYLFALTNFALIYWFNFVHKTGPTWREGSAVHYVLWQNRLATELAELIRVREPFWFSPALTWGTLVIEAGLPFLILSPVRQRLARPLAMAGIFALHGGISLFCSLGPFSYAMMTFSLLLPVRENWEALSRWRSKAKARTVVYDDASPFCHRLARILARLDGPGLLTFYGRSERREHRTPFTFAVEEPGTDSLVTGRPAYDAIARALPFGRAYGWALRHLLELPAARRTAIEAWLGWDRPLTPPEEPSPLARTLERLGLSVRDVLTFAVATCVASQLLMENRAVPPFLKPRSRPEVMTAVIDYLRIPQGWHMFAPDAPTTDVVLVAEATLADGSRVDLLTRKPPDFDALTAEAQHLGIQWCEYQVRVRGTPHLWRPFRDYLLRIDDIEGWPESKRIVKVDVWEIHSNAPPPGSTERTNVQRRLLFSSDTLG